MGTLRAGKLDGTKRETEKEGNGLDSQPQILDFIVLSALESAVQMTYVEIAGKSTWIQTIYDAHFLC